MTEAYEQPPINVQVGDFVCFERIGAERDWRNTIGKVVSFPTSQRARVVWYDRAETSPQPNPEADAKLRAVAEREGKIGVWNSLRELQKQLRQAQEEEDRASASLFKARDETVQRESAVCASTRAAMEALDRAREAMDAVPPRVWRAMRSQGLAPEPVISHIRAVFIALREDHTGGWEAMQGVMQQPDFMDRLMSLDCAAAPLTKQQKRRILLEIDGQSGAARKTTQTLRSVMSTQGSVPRSTTKSTTRASVAAPSGTQLEMVLNQWLHAQVACSDARLSEDVIVDECFNDIQEQAALAREVNSMRVNISMLQEKILERRGRICADKSLAEFMLEDRGYTTNAKDRVFYPRVDASGRPVTEIILLKSILADFGPKEREVEGEGETEVGYVCLTEEEAATLGSVVVRSNEEHDVQELVDLFASSDREEEEVRELRQRMEELRQKEEFTVDDEEEMRQLDVLLTDSIRRHEVTRWRIRQMQAAGRDQKYIEMRREAELVFSDLRVKFSGERWEELVRNDIHREALEEAFHHDIAKAFGVPLKNVTDIHFTPGPLFVDFKVKHSPDSAAEAVQEIANEAYFTDFTMLYEKLNNERAYPVNTPAQIAAYMRTQEYARLMNFSGAGVTEDVKDFEDSEEGETDDEDHRRVQIELAQDRKDYDPSAYYGFPFYGLSDVPEAALEFERGQMRAEARRALGLPDEEQQEEEEEIVVDGEVYKDGKKETFDDAEIGTDDGEEEVVREEPFESDVQNSKEVNDEETKEL